MLRVCRADSRSAMAHLCEVTTCGTRSLANFESNLSWDSRRDTARAMIPRTMIKMTVNASPNLVPIFRFPRNIVLLLVLVQCAGVAPGRAAAKSVALKFLAAPSNVLYQHATSVTPRSFGVLACSRNILVATGCILHAASRAVRLKQGKLAAPIQPWQCVGTKTSPLHCDAFRRGELCRTRRSPEATRPIA